MNLRQSYIIVALFAASLTGCGISAGGFVMGTTGYLHEVNRARGPEITPAERQQLSKLVREVQ